jgi:hypothetical protein
MSIRHVAAGAVCSPSTRDLLLLADVELAEGNEDAAAEYIRQIYEAFDRSAEDYLLE